MAEERGKIQRVMIGDLEADATLSERHGADVEVTRHPVEVGAKVASHFNLNPETVTLTCIFTDSPVDPKVAATATSITEGGRVNQVIARLYKLRESEELVTVTTRWRRYTNMKLSGLSLAKDVKTGRTVKADLTFIQVRTVSGATVKIRTLKPNGQRKKNEGPKPPKPVNQSVAKQAKEKVAKWLGLGG